MEDKTLHEKIARALLTVRSLEAQFAAIYEHELTEVTESHVGTARRYIDVMYMPLKLLVDDRNGVKRLYDDDNEDKQEVQA